MSNGIIDYPCSKCGQAICQCDRSATRSIQYNLEVIICSQCSDQFYCVNDLNNHRELRHPSREPLVAEIGGSNGVDVKHGL